MKPRTALRDVSRSTPDPIGEIVELIETPARVPFSVANIPPAPRKPDPTPMAELRATIRKEKAAKFIARYRRDAKASLHERVSALIVAQATPRIWADFEGRGKSRFKAVALSLFLLSCSVPMVIGWIHMIGVGR